jgi:LysM repeat protein
MRKFTPLITLLLLFFLVQHASAQDSAEPLWLLNSRDSLLLRVEEGRKFVLHPVKAKQTLFSIARYYNLSLEDLIEHNTTLKTEPSLRIGSRLKIPIPNKAIRRYKGKGFKAAEYTSIYYVVQQGDNLFQISKRFFDMPVDSVAKRNKVKNNNIKPGQRLHVGWMGIEGVHADWRAAKPAAEVNELKDRYTAEKKGRKEIDTQGVCFWQKDSKEKGDLYALHRDAAIGTIISVTNPMSRRTVFAKVISRIPDGYERNIEVILSPEAARKIGALDPKFFVKVKYLK